MTDTSGWFTGLLSEPEQGRDSATLHIKTANPASRGEGFTSLPCWFQAAAQVGDVLPPEFMQREEKLVSVR